MKQIRLRILPFLFLLSTASPVSAEEARVQEADSSPLAESAEDPTSTDDSEVVEAAEERVESALTITASMSIDESADIDPVAEAESFGLIIRVTLEEVKAALAAASATPGKEDDAAALRLLHFGSYRFYAEDSQPEP